MQTCITVSSQCKKRNGKQHLAICLSAALLCPFILSGCSEQQTEQENLIIMEAVEEEIEYSLAVAMVSDIAKTKKIRCKYEQLETMDLAFPVTGKTVKEVYVKAGDAVTKGQLLAELDIGEVDSKIRDLEYKIARNTLLLGYVDEDENYDISSMWHSYIFNSSHSEEKAEAVADSVVELQQQNEYTREDYRDAIAMDTLELEKIEKEIAQSRLCAEKDGTISFVKSNLEGTVSKADEKVMSIIAGTEAIFVAEDVEYAPYFAPESEVEISMLSGVGAGKYVLVPYKMEEWDETMMFTFVDETDGAAVNVGDSGTMEIILDKRELCLNIPSSAVHTADGKEYVYVVGEGNMREVKWIETGLYGDSDVEILSGLSEGEKVILK